MPFGQCELFAEQTSDGASGSGRYPRHRPFQQHVRPARDQPADRRPIADDYQQFGVLRDAVAELEVREDRTPGRRGAAGRVPVPARPLSPGDRNADDRPTAARWPTSTSARASSPSATTPRRSRRYAAGQDGRLQRRRLRAGHGRGPCATPGDAEEVAGSARQAVRRRRADGRVPVSARGDGRGAGRQSDRSDRAASSGPSKSDADAPGRAVRPGPARTTAAATTKPPVSSTSGPPSSFPRNVGTLINLGLLYEDSQQFERAQQCYQRDARRRIPTTRGPGCTSRTPTPRATCSTTKRPSRRQDRLAPDAQHAGHRLRALGPQPQLPAEDGHPDARRPDARRPSRSCWPARISARRRWSKSARCCTPRAWSWASSPPTKWQEEPAFEPDVDERPTSRPCSSGRSPTSTSRCGPASAWSAWA